MDQQNLSTLAGVVNATEEFLKTQIVQKDQRIAQLEEQIQKVTQRSYSDSADRNRMVEGMQHWTLAELERDSITESQATEIAEIMGFELTKEVEVEVSVTYNLTLQVPYDEDVESIVNDVDFESVSYNSDNITWLTASVDRIDF
jgi:hypothetical protein